jgi:hypothetical protein
VKKLLVITYDMVQQPICLLRTLIATLKTLSLKLSPRRDSVPLKKH